MPQDTSVVYIHVWLFA